MKKNKIPSPLTAGAIIARRTVTLGMGHEAIITVTYDGPNEPAPDTGTQWPPERDWPAAKLAIHLPNRYSGSQRPKDDLIANIQIAGNRLDTDSHVGSGNAWGEYGGATAYRHVRRAGTSLRKIAADLLRETMADLRPLQSHLSERAARIAQREATLAAGLDMAPLKS